MLDSDLIDNQVSSKWHDGANFPEFFLFARNQDIHLALRDVNGDWQILELVGMTTHGLEELIITADTIQNSKIGHQVGMMFLDWRFAYQGRSGEGGFQHSWQQFQAIDVDRGVMVFDEVYANDFSSSESYAEEGGHLFERTTCQYRRRFERQNDTILLGEVELIANEVEKLFEPDDADEDRVREHQATDPDCLPERRRGVYVYDGKRYRIQD